MCSLYVLPLFLSNEPHLPVLPFRLLSKIYRSHTALSSVAS